ncbi:transposase [Nocardia callitridis]|uniref:Transposase n=1 Tax=Nocardia callitridis TaxID=648753 RepID=A0ABP9KEL7_9NOCA
MGSTRRSFTEEYRAQAVAFVVYEGRPVAEVARNIGVHEMTLRKWVVRRATFDWIENYYNTDRRHSALNYLAPREYSLGYREISQIAA